MAEKSRRKEAEAKLAEALASKAHKVREEFPEYDDGTMVQLHSLKTSTEYNGLIVGVVRASVHRRHYEIR